MNYWIFTVTGHKTNGEVLSAEDIFAQRMEDRFWGLSERTPNRKSLQKGDKVVYYLGQPSKVFAGTATLASSSFDLDNAAKDKYAHGKLFYTSDYGVLLENIEGWESPKPVEGMLHQLKFIENKQFWFSYFQGGIRQIAEEDFNTIVGRGVLLTDEKIRTGEIESATEFALESHLEEFIHQNWPHIDFDSVLRLYQTEDQNGRQFPAGTWSIDFLAVDVQTNDLVVVELKKGKTSDSAVGQLLRYISWVKDTIAEPGQNVRGIIVAKEVDDALKYAVKNLDYVEVKTYKVDFRLLPFEK